MNAPQFTITAISEPSPTSAVLSKHFHELSVEHPSFIGHDNDTLVELSTTILNQLPDSPCIVALLEPRCYLDQISMGSEIISPLHYIAARLPSHCIAHAYAATPLSTNVLYHNQSGIHWPLERSLTRVQAYQVKASHPAQQQLKPSSHFEYTLHHAVRYSSDGIDVHYNADFVSTVAVAFALAEEAGLLAQAIEYWHRWYAYVCLAGPTRSLRELLVDMDRIITRSQDMHIQFAHLFILAQISDLKEDVESVTAAVSDLLKFNRAVNMLKEEQGSSLLFEEMSYYTILTIEQQQVLKTEFSAILQHDEYMLLLKENNPIAFAATDLKKFGWLNESVRRDHISVKKGKGKLPQLRNERTIVTKRHERHGGLIYTAQMTEYGLKATISVPRETIGDIARGIPRQVAKLIRGLVDSIEINGVTINFANNTEAKSWVAEQEVIRAFLSGELGKQRAVWMFVHLLRGNIEVSSRSRATYAKFFNMQVGSQLPVINTALCAEITEELPVIYDSEKEKLYVVLSNDIDPIRVKRANGALKLGETGDLNHRNGYKGVFKYRYRL
eukprot:TRINITY_DN63645_c0_g1_i1.p1 TRINITY_DN63645_c0_g1~~TRINITY_DN63645_c0_g1_i1.p1  ORF type:complete len:570 (+),score=85.17 TRINITY_DN63645_c0_g1_i1:44-1711(+)